MIVMEIDQLEMKITENRKTQLFANANEVKMNVLVVVVVILPAILWYS